MFNKIILSQERTKYVPYTKTIIEKKAPTDDSIRLFNEIKEKAYNSIIDTIELKDNILNINAIVFKDPESFNNICKFSVSLNGMKIVGEITIESFYDKTEAIKEIYRQVSEIISMNLIKKLLNAPTK